MHSAISLRLALLAFLCAGSGCGSAPGPDDKANATNGNNPPAATAPAPLVITGKVTLPDGRTPPTGEVKDIQLNIYGISEASGEKLSYTPAVKADGTYRQKVVAGQFSFNRGNITMIFNGTTEFTLPLEPVGSNWNKDRDAADGIVQDFVWHPTGPTPYGKTNGLDTRNHTHWYGLSVGMDWSSYRSDLKQPAPLPPDGTKLVFTCVPKSKAIDGTTPTTFQREMTIDAKAVYSTGGLNDLPPANYEITGVATLPDGTTKTLVFQGKGHYPNYVKTLPVILERDGGGYFKLLATFGFE